jgi:predicted nucleic acid-binding protein
MFLTCFSWIANTARTPLTVEKTMCRVWRYADLPLGFADASVIACAERHGGRVLTLDLRHFGVVAGEGRLTLIPE